MPAWSTNQLSRLTGTPKRHLVEPALLGPLVGVDTAYVLRDPELLGGCSTASYAGPHLYPLDDQMHAVPICSLWAP